MSDLGDMPRRPRVSVVIPAYNHARFLPDALDSVLAQTFQDFEVVVVDDGSTDETGEVVAAYGNRIRYVRQSNAGQAAARNRGIRETSAPFIAFLDAYDYWFPEKLTAQMAHFDAHPEAGVVFTQFVVTNAEGTPLYVYPAVFRYGRNAFEAMLVWPVGWMNVAMVRRTCFDAVGLLDETIRWPTDWDLWLRLTRHFGVGFVHRPLAIYRQLDDSLSRQIRNPMAVAEVRKVLDKVFEDPDLAVRLGSNEVVRLRRLAYASLEVTIGLNMATDRWLHLCRAIRLHPGILAIRWRAVALLLLRPFFGDRLAYLADAIFRGFPRPPRMKKE